MKWIIFIILAGAILFFKPWTISSGNKVTATDSTNITYHNQQIPVHQVINNDSSELEVARRFDRIICKFMQQWEIKGASFALMKDDRLIYSKGYGYADEEAGIKTDVMHIFRVASISKLITGVAIMKLQEEGKLKLSDHVFGLSGILNDSLYQDITDKRSEKITIEHLLRHQGGYTNSYGDPMFCPLAIAQKMNVPPPADLSTIIRFVLSRRLKYTPGTSTSYSNIGYGILSQVIEKASGNSYEEYIRKNILRPIGCYDMHLGRNLYEEKLPNEVKYYEVSDAEQIPACDGSGRLVARSNGGNNIEALYGAGGWVASPTELLRFMAAIDGNPVIEDILSPQSIEYMTRHIPNTLPIGWIGTTKQEEWIRTGTLAGTSALMKKQNDGYAWVFLTNTSSWKGSHFPRYIDTAIDRAMATVTEWPERDLFEIQPISFDKFLVNYQ